MRRGPTRSADRRRANVLRLSRLYRIIVRGSAPAPPGPSSLSPGSAMSPYSRIVAAAVVLFAAGASHAQFVGGFGQRQSIGFHVRTGPYSSLTYVAGGYGYGFGPIYGPVPSWYYGWPGVPLTPYPFVVQPPVTPVIVQNI